MIRRIIRIDSDKCNGCGLCAQACHEGAIGMVNGKAALLREDHCDGLGDCLPACPVGAISFEEREAPAYDEAAVQANLYAKAQQDGCTGGGCPGARTQTIRRAPDAAVARSEEAVPASRLGQWPVQIKLAPVNAPFLQGADLLIAADCTAYAFADMHERFMRGRVTLIGCPKLDATDYADKLAAMLQNADVRSITVVRMEVPCCGGIVNAVKAAMQRSGKLIPWQVVTLSTDGRIL